MSSETPIAETPPVETPPAETPTDTAQTTNDNYYDNTTMMMTIAFLGIYFAVYAISGMFFKRDDPNFNSTMGGSVEFIVFAIVIAISIVYYLNLSETDQSTFFDDLKKGARNYFNNAYTIIQVLSFIALFYLGVFLFKIPIPISLLESKAFILLIALLAVQFFKKVLGIRIVDHIYNMDLFEKKKPAPETPKEEAEEAEEDKKEVIKDEVFNISNNLFTFDEIEDAYAHGAEWSSYGWSAGQHAYFPTQKDTWNKLQTVKGHEHDLGRPGVNGGYFNNPNIRFGVNCYGVKPAMSDAEKKLMDSRKEHIYPKTDIDILLDKKVKFFQDHKDKLLVINGYNTDKWSKH
jgi:hypothetical protein